MNRNVMIGIVIAAAVAGGLRYQRYRAAQNETHQVVFKVEGPTTCNARITMETGATPAHTELTVPWVSDATEVHGHTTVRLRVDFAVGCAAPQTVSCMIERDGSPWKDARGRVLSNTRAENANVLCEVEGDPAGGLSSAALSPTARNLPVGPMSGEGGCYANSHRTRRGDRQPPDPAARPVRSERAWRSANAARPRPRVHRWVHEGPHRDRHRESA